MAPLSSNRGTARPEPARPDPDVREVGDDLVTYRVGVDVGGTFTDLVCVGSTGCFVLEKNLTTPEDPSIGVMKGLGRLAEAAGLNLAELCRRMDTFVHGTTVVDNTMVEMSGARTGMLVTEGHRDEIELRRVHKEQIWDPTYPPPTPIARRRVRIPIPERVDFAGSVLLPLDEETVRRGARRLKALGVESVAIAFLFSFVNPRHERRARELLLEEFPEVGHVSLSHEVLPRAPEFERASTTLVNAYVAPRVASYVGNLVDRLREAGFGGEMVLMQSTGGVMPPAYAERRAVSLLGSGPTGGVIGAAHAAKLAAVGDFVAVDMGGTSYDICLVRGTVPEVSTDWNWRYRYYIGVPMVDVRAMGAGGGSIARVRHGALLVGPQSAGSVPGPACYGRGGDRATVTDADCVLGYLATERFAGGRLALDAGAARAAIARHVSIPLGLSVEDAAWAIERMVNANMTDALREVLAGYGADPRELAMIAYGGNGPVHAWLQARELGIQRVLVPKPSPAFSALGLLVADYKADLLRAYLSPLALADCFKVHSLMAELSDEAVKELEPAGLERDELSFSWFAQLCYPGQSFDLSVPIPEGDAIAEGGLSALAERFHVVHEAERGFAFPVQVPLMRGVRLIAQGRTPKPPRLWGAEGTADASSARSGDRRVHLGDGFVDVPVYDGSQIGTGASVEGPALIEECFTVVVLAPGDSAVVDGHGTYDISIAVPRGLG